MSAIHIMTMAWGSPFIDWLSRFALPSLYQSGNVPALIAAGHDVRHTVFTTEHEMPAIIEAGAFHGAKLRVEAFRLDKPATLRKVQAELLIHAAERALADDAYFVPASSVTIWSDGSLANIIKTAETLDCAVGAIYLGIDPDKWSARQADYGSFPTGISGAALASEAIDMLFPGSRSTLDRETSRCHLTGNGMLQLAPDLLALRCQVPSVAAIRFKPSDVALFRLEGDFRAWDGGAWMGRLIQEGRYVFLASNELAFQVNLMRPDKQNTAAYDALAASLGPLLDRRYAARATIQGEAARGFMCAIRTSRAVTL